MKERRIFILKGGGRGALAIPLSLKESNLLKAKREELKLAFKKKGRRPSGESRSALSVCVGDFRRQ